jgi:hypothetical protein
MMKILDSSWKIKLKNDVFLFYYFGQSTQLAFWPKPEPKFGPKT